MAVRKPSELALDLCCGTGDVALALARRGAVVAGVDFSAPMLAVARARCGRQMSRPQGQCQDRISLQLVRADALRVPFPDNAFDAVTIAYGLRNLANFTAGLAEMKRVAKPGGRLLVLDFGKPPNWLWRAIYFAYLQCLGPLFGRLCCGDADTYGYILASLKQYPAQPGVAEMLQAIHCVKVRTISLVGGAMSISYGEKACSNPPSE
jgi:demethylmenaquinone methyltransferase/2-methoxy-6-polyprenyl-1,4-benzoquinol methylase